MDKIDPPEPSLPYAEQPQLFQSLLMCRMLQSLSHQHTTGKAVSYGISVWYHDKCWHTNSERVGH